MERGRFVYSLKIEERWQTREEAEQEIQDALGGVWLDFRFPGVSAVDVTPKSPWNYALEINAQTAPDEVRIVENEWADENPFSPPFATYHTCSTRATLGWMGFQSSTEVMQRGSGTTLTKCIRAKATSFLPRAYPKDKVKLGASTEKHFARPLWLREAWLLTTFPNAKDFA